MPIFGKNKKDDKNQNLPAEENAAPAEEVTSAAPAAETTVPETPAAETTVSENGAIPTAVSMTDGERPKFHTPEGFDFNRYFLAERRVVLDNISYETQRPTAGQTQYKLNGKDTIVAQVLGQAGVKCTFNRTLKFEPEGPFVLSVSFGVMLIFNPGTRGEIDWHTIDLAEEFKKNCPALVQAMAAKTTLLVAEITNASNGMPIIPMR